MPRPRTKQRHAVPERHRNIGDLLAAVQQHAIEEWNSDPERPSWDRGGVALKTTAPFTPNPDRVTYLTVEATRELRMRFEEEWQRDEWERRARALMQTLAWWVVDVDTLLAEAKGDEAFFGLAMNDLRRLWHGEPWRPPDVPKARDFLARSDVEAWRAIRSDSDDSPRVKLVSQMLSGMVTFEKRGLTNREFALASLLCGILPDEIWNEADGHTVDEVIEAEVRAIRKARQRFARRRAVRTGRSPS